MNPLYKCLCGHTFITHLTENDGIILLPKHGEHWCLDCSNALIGGLSDFHTFKLDNLTYLEYKYEQSTKS